MSGNRYLLDTNAVIALLREKEFLGQELERAQWIGISVITRLEFLCFEGLADSDRSSFMHLCERLEIVDVSNNDDALMDTTERFRKQYRLRLPDAVIAATAVAKNAILVTSDSDFDRVIELRRYLS